jgi:hypothetical protein
MNKTQLVLTLLGSAAIGALVSSVITAFAQYLDRRARRQELLLKEALELAQWRIDVMVANLKGQRGELKDKIVLAETYYGYLQHLMEHGKLPDDPRIER